MELQAITGQLHVVNGQVQESPSAPGLMAATAPSEAARGRQADFFFAHLSLSGPPESSATLAQDLLDLIAQRYFETRGSVTAALRNAILQANQRLLQLNMSGAVSVREGALSCAVVRDAELFLAQTGECIAFLGHNFGIERLPQGRPAQVTPMGRSAGLDVRYFHNWLQPGDMLLLADPRMAHLPSSAFEAALIDSDVEDGLAHLTELIGSDSARLILVEMSDQAPSYIPDGQPRRYGAGASSDRTSSQLLPPPVGAPKRNVAVAPTAPRAAPPGIARPKVDVETVETSARRATSRAARQLSKGTGWLADFLAALRPASSEGGRPGLSWAVPAILAIAIPILVAAVVTGVYLQRGQAIELGDLKHQMSQNLALGRQSGEDTAAAAEHFGQVIQLANEALELRPEDPDVLRLRQEALVELDGISGVARLATDRIHLFETDTRLSAIALGDRLNGDIYLLDEAEMQVFRLATDEDYLLQDGVEPEQIIFREQVIGSHVVNTIADIYWRPRGSQVSRDGLAMLDERGALVTFYPDFQDERAVTLGLASDWVDPVAAAGFSERLYVLDPLANRIWRYYAEGDSLTLNEESRSLEFVEDAELSRVIDFEIYSEDGSVILLYDDGRLRRYVNGRLLWDEADVAANGLNVPLSSPAALKIGGSGLNSSLFVADAGNGRIVQLSLGGTYLAQFRATDENGLELFAQVSDFEVAEDPLRFFTVADRRLHLSRQP